MAIKRELVQFIIENSTDCDYNIPMFQQNVYSINATTKYSWDITTAVLTCGTGTIIVNSVTYSLSYTPTLSGLISALNALGFGFFCTETIGGSTFIYVVDDTNIYGDLDLCPSGITTTTTTTTTTAGTTTSTTTSTTTGIPTTSTTTTSTTIPSTSTTTSTTTGIPTTSTTSTTTTSPSTSTTTSTTTSPSTSTTTSTTTAPETSTTTTTTTIPPTTSTTTTTTTTLTFSIGFGGAYEDACNFLASGTVTGDDSVFCNCTTFTGSIFAAASTGTWYVSFGGNYVSVSVTNGNPVATVTGGCTACTPPTTTSTTTSTTTL